MDFPGYKKPEGTQIWQISNHTMNLLYQYENYQDLSDKTVAKNFFTFAADYASADHLMVIFWDHGGGPIKGAEFALNDDGSDNRFMPFNDIAEAVESVKELRIKQGKQIDMIGFDCCLMGSVEIAYVDIYLMAKALVGENITEDLTAAANKLIAAVGDGSFPEPKEIPYEEWDKEKEEEITVYGPGGQIGIPGDGGAVKYRGVSYGCVGCAGLAMFCPANLEVESVYLDAVTGKNRTVEKYKGIYNDVYNSLAFSRSGNAYVEFVKSIAGLQDESRDFGAQSGYIKAYADEETNAIYMDIKDGDPSRLIKVYAEFSFETYDGDYVYYLGSKDAVFNEEKGRYEVPDRHRWMSIDGVPVTYEDHGFGECILPVVIEIKGDKGRFAEGKYKEGDVVAAKDICYLYINPDEGEKGDAVIYKWYDPYMSQSHGVESKSDKMEMKFHPLCQRLIWNEEEQVFDKGDFIAYKAATVVVKEETLGDWVERSVYLKNAVMKRPSEAPNYLISYNFKAYDLNTKAHISNPVYSVELDWSKLGIDPIKDQTCTGKAIQPKLTFTFAGESGIKLEDLQSGSSGIKINVAYYNNINAGTAKVIVTGIEKGTNEILYTLERTFKIVRAPNNLKVKKKTVKVNYAKLRRKAQIIKASKIKKGNSANTKIKYKLIKANKKKKSFVVKPSGQIKVKKGTKRGTYKLTIKATVEKTGIYQSATKKFVVTIKIK